MWAAIAMMIIKLIDVVEEVYKGQVGKGTVKKEAVMTATQAIVSDVTAISTGGQKETWEKIAPLISSFVDTAVKITNDIRPGTVSDEDFENRKAGILP